jgi:hypothetical protein
MENVPSRKTQREQRTTFACRQEVANETDPDHRR